MHYRFSLLNNACTSSQVNEDDNDGEVRTEMLNFRRKAEILDLVAEELPPLIESTMIAMILWPIMEDDQKLGFRF